MNQKAIKPSSSSMFRCLESVLHMIVDCSSNVVVSSSCPPINVQILLQTDACNVKLMPVQVDSVEQGLCTQFVTFQCPFHDQRCTTKHVVSLLQGGPDSEVDGAAISQPFRQCLDNALRLGNWQALHDFAVTQAYHGFRLESGPSCKQQLLHSSGATTVTDRSDMSTISAGGITAHSSPLHNDLANKIVPQPSCRLSRACVSREVSRVRTAFAIQSLIWQHMVRYWESEGKSTEPDIQQIMYLLRATAYVPSISV